MKKIIPYELCIGFPIEYIQLYQKIIRINEDDWADYKAFIRIFQNISNDNVNEYKNLNWKLKWIYATGNAVKLKK